MTSAMAARLVVADEYGIKGFEAFYGFIAGMCAGNYDITDIFVDSTLKIGGRDMEAFADFIEMLSKLQTNMVLSISADQERNCRADCGVRNRTVKSGRLHGTA